MSASVLAAATPRAVWYLSRGTGAVTLVGLTATVTLGILDVRRWRSRRWPRFVLDALHRDVALITLAVLLLHVITAIVDTFAPIRLIDAVIPFASPYRPLWLGLGALALDLLLAVAITSGLRRRLGHRAWRAVHWTAYACWPLALVHGLGSGSDVRATWLPALSATCVVVVLAAVGWRIGAAGRPGVGAKLGAVGALVAGCVALAAWALDGPLAPGWAFRAGTPVGLLPHAVSARTAADQPHGVLARTVAHQPHAVSARPATQLPSAFTARLAGSVAERVSADGAHAALDFPLVLRGPTAGSLHVQLSGRVVPGGGVTLGASRVTLGPPSAPALYRGRITALARREVAAVVRAPTGRRLRLRIVLAVDAARRVAGTVVAE